MKNSETWIHKLVKCTIAKTQHIISKQTWESVQTLLLIKEMWHILLSKENKIFKKKNSHPQLYLESIKFRK